ncbi:MAG TPA: hypothetical protein VF594_02120 [Rubricoccaceae bacterium]|jgi:hypothetical protein
MLPACPRLVAALVLYAWALAAWTPTARAQDNRFVSGSVSVSGRSLLGWSETITGSVVLRLDATDEDGGEHYVLDTASYSWRAFGTVDGCTVSGQAQIAETEESAATLSVYPDASYHATSVALELASDPARVTITCPTYSLRLSSALGEFLHVPTAAETGGEPFRFVNVGAIRALDGTWGSGEVGDPRFTWSLTAAPPAPVAGEPNPSEPASGPDALALSPPAPNPARGQAALVLTVSRTGHVTAAAFDVLGRRVATLHDGPVAGGAPLPLVFDVAGLPAGPYVVRAAGNGASVARRVTVSK